MERDLVEDIYGFLGGGMRLDITLVSNEIRGVMRDLNSERKEVNRLVRSVELEGGGMYVWVLNLGSGMEGCGS